MEIGVWIERIKNGCILKSAYSAFNWFARFTVDGVANALRLVNLLVTVPANAHLIVRMESKCMVIAVFSM